MRTAFFHVRRRKTNNNAFWGNTPDGNLYELAVPNREVRNIIISRIMIKIDDSDTGIIIEVKYSETNDLEMDCKKALRQVDETGYSEALHQEDVNKILKYGIACRRKDCRVILETEY